LGGKRWYIDPRGHRMGGIRRNAYPQELEKKGLPLKSSNQ
jgi:hypothetical protein